MPTYDYRCTDCGREFEAFQSISEDPLNECEVCGGKVERLLSSGSGLIFKGSGFYITDYKKSNGSPSSSEKRENKDSSKDESSKSESKKSEGASAKKESKATSDSKSD